MRSTVEGVVADQAPHLLCGSLAAGRRGGFDIYRSSVDRAGASAAGADDIVDRIADFIETMTEAPRHPVAYGGPRPVARQRTGE